VTALSAVPLPTLLHFLNWNVIYKMVAVISDTHNTVDSKVQQTLLHTGNAQTLSLSTQGMHLGKNKRLYSIMNLKTQESVCLLKQCKILL
jgi:hypothetical protein